MSKTTNKHGKPLYSATNTPDASPVASPKLKRQLKKLDIAAKKMTACADRGCCGRRYDDLTDKEKVELHYQITIARERARHDAESKAMSDEAEIGLED